MGNRLFSTIVSKLRRDSGRSFSERIGKWTGLVAHMATASVHLRDCNQVGFGARTVGEPRILNLGRIDIGARFLAGSVWCPMELITGPAGHIEIADDVEVNYGAVISAKRHVRIGNRVSIGQYAIVADTELPGPFSDTAEEAKPIEIGDDVWVAGRVIVLPGTRIGNGSVIAAGSIVSGDVPPGVIAGGIPARVLRRIGADAEKEHGTPAQISTNDLLSAAAPRVDAISCGMVSSGVLYADFTIVELAHQLCNTNDEPALKIVVVPCDQVMSELRKGQSDAELDFAVIWTRPERSVPCFARILDCLPVAEEDLLSEVDAFCATVVAGCRLFKHAFVPTWTVPGWQRGCGVLNGREGGLTRALAKMNLRLMEQLGQSENIFVLDAQRWVTVAGESTKAARLWQLGRIPFNDQVFVEAASDIKAAIRVLSGRDRKLIVLDLDDTLWGGSLGTVGWQNLRLGGQDTVGRSFVDFQEALKNLTRRGVMLGIVSKGEESTMLNAVRSHPEMVLREDDFVGWRINLRDKVENIADLAAELKLGLESVVFIDDDPVERHLVRETLSDVLVPEWPEDRLLYVSALASLNCFDVLSFTSEDCGRTKMHISA